MIIWAITNNAAMNTHVQAFICTDVLISLGCRPRSEVTLVYTVALCLTLQGTSTKAEALQNQVCILVRPPDGSPAR